MEISNVCNCQYRSFKNLAGNQKDTLQWPPTRKSKRKVVSIQLMFGAQLCDKLTPALDRYFPEDSGVRLIAEPGRYFVESAFTVAVNIIAKRVMPRDNPSGYSGQCHTYLVI